MTSDDEESEPLTSEEQAAVDAMTDRYKVFIPYGELMLALQALEFSISTFLVRNIKNKSTFDQAMDKVEKWNATTMGALVRGLKSQAHWPEGIVDDLEAAVELRNWLAHHFLLEYFVVSPSLENTERAVEYLDAKLEQIEALDTRLEAHLRALGVPVVDDLDEETLALIEGMRPKDWTA